MKATQRRLHSYRHGLPGGAACAPALAVETAPSSDGGIARFASRLAGVGVEISLPRKPCGLLISVGGPPAFAGPLPDWLGRVEIDVPAERAKAAIAAVAGELGRLPETRGLALALAAAGDHARDARAAVADDSARFAALLLDRELPGPVCLTPTFTADRERDVTAFLERELFASPRPAGIDRRRRRLLARRLERGLRRGCRRRAPSGLSGRVRAGVAGLAAALAFSFGLGFGAAPAQAAFSGTFDSGSGQLELSDDASDSGLKMSCEAGRMGFNGDAELPGLPSGGVACADINSIEIAAGGGVDEINLSDLGTADFNGIAPVTVFGAAGADELSGPRDIASVLEGGDGNDVINGGLADATSGDKVSLRGDLGDDTLTAAGGGHVVNGGSGTDLAIRAANADFSFPSANRIEADGLGTDSLFAIEEVSLSGGPGGNELDGTVLDASAWTELEALTLAGAGGDDTLIPADTLATALYGGAGGIDRIEHAPSNVSSFTLTDTLLSLEGAAERDHPLHSIERASLVGLFGTDTLDASQFNGGGVTLDVSAAFSPSVMRGSPASDALIGPGRVAQEVNADQTLTGGLLTGDGDDTLTDVTVISLSGGAGNNELDASQFTGQAYLDGAEGNDMLRQAPPGGDIDGGTGTDSLVAAPSDAPVIMLTDTMIGTSYVSEIESASVTGGPSANDIDASAFTGGPVTLAGLDGNDTLTGTVLDDSLDAGDGVDGIARTADADMTLTGGSLEVQGADSDALAGFEQASLAGGASPNLLDATGFGGPVTLDGQGGDDTLTGSGQDDRLVGGSGIDLVTQSSDAASQVLTATGLTGRGTDTLSAIELASLTGGPAANEIDAVAFAGISGGGFVTLTGEGGGDTLIGNHRGNEIDGGDGGDDIVAHAGDDSVVAGPGQDTVLGGDGADQVEGGDGDDSLDAGREGDTVLAGPGDDVLVGGQDSGAAVSGVLNGGTGTDSIVQDSFNDLTITDTLLSSFNKDDTLAAIESASLSGSGAKDASGFLAGPVTLEGGSKIGSPAGDLLIGGSVVQEVNADQALTDTLLTGVGDDTLDGVTSASLTGGFQANELDASQFNGGPVSLDGGNGNDTLRQAPAGGDLIGGGGTDVAHAAARDATLIQVTDTQISAGPTLPTALSDVERLAISGGPSANNIDASAFTRGPVTLAGEDGDDTLEGTDSADSLDAGPGDDFMSRDEDADMTLTEDLVEVEGTASDSLAGFERVYLRGGVGSNRLDASEFEGSVTLDGFGGGDNTLLGAAGDDSLIGTGGGTDLVVQESDAASQVLAPGQLTGDGTDTLEWIERASLTGGPSANTIDASAFFGPGIGNVTITGGGGGDTLTGSAGSNLADEVIGGPGSDSITGAGTGADTLRAIDGEVDTLECGTGTGAVAKADEIDIVNNCATVENPPETSIWSGPDTLTNDPEPVFILDSDQPGSTWECRVYPQGGSPSAWTNCLEQQTLSPLDDGDHRFEARATKDGNTDLTPAVFDFTVDTTPPETTIGPGPADGSSIKTSSASFGFSADEAGSSFECSLDDGAWSPCTSPQSYNDLDEGAHSFAVRATDEAGNTGPAVERTFTVDTTAPETTISSGPAGTIATATATFGFASSEPGGAFICRLDSGPLEACNSGSQTYTGLGNGTHTFRVFAIDAAGNADPSPATREFTVDAPVTSPPTPGGPDTTGPTIRLFGPKQQRSPKKVVVKAACADEPCDLRAAGKIKVKVFKGKKVKKTKTLRLKQATKTGVAAGKTTKLKLKLNKKGKRLVKKALNKKPSKATIKVTASDEAGNATQAKRKVKVMKKKGKGGKGKKGKGKRRGS